jgi:S1-C subfamily serine protease
VAVIHVEDRSPPGIVRLLGAITGHHSDQPLGATPFLTLLQAAPTVGSRVRIVGYGQHANDVPHQRIESGIIWTTQRSVVDPIRILSMIFLDGGPTNGDSGAPVLNQQGRVVGMLAWTPEDSKTVAFAISTPDVRCKP